MFIEKYQEALKLNFEDLSFEEKALLFNSKVHLNSKLFKSLEFRKRYSDIYLLERKNFSKYCELTSCKFTNGKAANLHRLASALIDAYEEDILSREALEKGAYLISFWYTLVYQYNESLKLVDDGELY